MSEYSELPKSKTTPDESGVILVFLTIVIFAIITFLTLGIDTAQYSVSSSEQQSTAERASLAALQKYATTPYDPLLSDADNNRARLTAAIDRAEEIIGSSMNVLYSQEVSRQIDHSANEIKDTSNLTGRANADGGTITPGRYYFSAPNNDCAKYVTDNPAEINEACPCYGGVWNGECFRPIRDATEVPLSFEINLKTKDDSLLRSYFGKLIGQKSLSISSKARAAVVASAAVYALDLSPSTTYDTHLPYSSLPAGAKQRASQYVFQLAGTAGSSCNASHSNPCVGLDSCQFAPPNDGLSRCVFYGRGTGHAGKTSRRSAGACAYWGCHALSGLPHACHSQFRAGR